MMDEADRAQPIIEQAVEDAVKRIRQKQMDPGKPGECERCGEYSKRLVKGVCARCRERYRLP